jgi:hypothetical protein
LEAGSFELGEHLPERQKVREKKKRKERNPLLGKKVKTYSRMFGRNLVL